MRLDVAAVTMPVAIFTELKVQRVGEIVAAGAEIATVVPADAPLFVEATVMSKDVGFLRPGVERGSKSMRFRSSSSARRARA